MKFTLLIASLLAGFFISPVCAQEDAFEPESIEIEYNLDAHYKAVIDAECDKPPIEGQGIIIDYVRDAQGVCVTQVTDRRKESR